MNQVSTNKYVLDYSILIDTLFENKPTKFQMDDGGLSVEWNRMVIRIFPPNDEVPSKIEVVIHNLRDYETSELFVDINNMQINELENVIRN